MSEVEWDIFSMQTRPAYTRWLMKYQNDRYQNAREELARKNREYEKEQLIKKQDEKK